MKHATSQRRQRRFALTHCGLAALGLSAVANPSLAADRSWTNTAGGVFSTASNWQNGLFGGVNDAANFNNSTLFGQQNYTITFSSTAQNQALKVKNDFVTFDLSGRTYTTTLLSANEIGSIGSNLTSRVARLTIQNGTFTTPSNAEIKLGAVANSFGSLTVTTGGVLNGLPRILVGG